MIRSSLRGMALAAVLLPVLLAACNGSGGDAPSDPPANVAVTAGDTSVTVTWTAEPGLTYWIFLAAAPSITRDNYNQFPGARIIQPATSPQLIGGLANGTTYSFIVNATRDGGPAGPTSASIAAVPRLAGATWTVGTPLGTDLNGLTLSGSSYLAVGAGGALFSSPTAESGSWTAGSSGVTATLNGIATGVGAIVAVGDGGTIVTSTDITNWTARTSGTTVRLNAVAAGLGAYIAVGDGGTVLLSSDATVWTPASSGTSENLLGVSFLGSVAVAVGANGTLLTSADSGATWVPRTSGTTASLRSVAVSPTLFAAVGDGGALVTSADAATWTARTAIAAQNLRRIVYGTQFITVGDGGTALTSPDGLTWSAANSGTVADLRGLVQGARLNYVAVGAGGANIVAN